MMIDTKDGRLLINEAAYAVIRENAPQELPLYVNTRERYFTDPGTFLTPPKSRDDPLAFGRGAAISAFSQVVFPVLAPILVLLMDEAAKALGKGAGESAASWVGGLFKEEAAQKEPEIQPIFTQAQLVIIESQINTIAEHEAQRLGLNRSQVLVVRDAIITKLVLTNS